MKTIVVVGIVLCLVFSVMTLSVAIITTGTGQLERILTTTVLSIAFSTLALALFEFLELWEKYDD